MPLSITPEEIQRDIDDGEWWQSIFKPLGCTVVGFTYRESATVHDPKGQYNQITGPFAEAIKAALERDTKRR